MNNGMLWYDNQTGQSIEARLQRAIDYFIGKYGHPPLCCFVNPGMVTHPVELVSNVRVIPNERVLQNHIWLEIGKKEG